MRRPAMPLVDEREESAIPTGRLIMVSNRLSVTVKLKADGGYDFKPSSGGLATGLAGLTKSTEFSWYGWPGLEVPPEKQESMREECATKHKAVPVFMSHELSERHYNGFSNEILWPLFHYHPQGIEFADYAWEGYQEANQLFAKTVAKDVRDGDMVWVQDYHLMLLPAMLREELKKMEPTPRNVKIGFFLHTPFPSSEIYRILPVRNEILDGVLASDLVGFHTVDYARHFLSACSRIMDLHQTPDAVLYGGRAVTVATFPIGIEPEEFTDGLDSPKVKARIEVLERSFRPFTVIVGCDRLDYIKGVQQKLHALDIFFSEHPGEIGKVKLVQIAVPSRGDVDEYRKLRDQVNQLVGYINGKYGTVEYQPVHFMHQSVDKNELIALYAVSDVCLVTSTRDGMNLVSFEYIVCQRDRHGVLVLSEFAGAAESLHGALIINPWDAEDVAESIYQAVNMDDFAREQRYEKMSRYVHRHTSQWWGNRFVKALTDIARVGEAKGLKTRSESRVGPQKEVKISVPEAMAVDSAHETSEEQSPEPEKTGQGHEEKADSDNDGPLMMKPSPRPVSKA